MFLTDLFQYIKKGDDGEINKPLPDMDSITKSISGGIVLM